MNDSHVGQLAGPTFQTLGISRPPRISMNDIFVCHVCQMSAVTMCDCQPQGVVFDVWVLDSNKSSAHPVLKKHLMSSGSCCTCLSRESLTNGCSHPKVSPN